jgi:ACS family pantothenate transporter-like MFS transporter
VIFWVKSYNTAKTTVFSVAAINIIPLGVGLSGPLIGLGAARGTAHVVSQINILTIIGALTSSWISDSLPRSARWPSMAFASFAGIIFPIALATTPVHPANRGTRWALYCE